jgi:uncharacterized protein (TIGR02145 family)
MRTITTILFLCFVIGRISAQSPSRMSYQAVVRNATNALVVNVPVKMRITILQGAMATAVYTELHNPTTNANGLVSIEIGGGISSSGSFTGIDWSKGPFFIKTETDPANGTNYSISGTTQLLSVPYAMYTGDVNSTLSKTGDTLSIGSKRYVIPGIKDVSGIGVSAAGITSHSCGASNVHNPAIPYGTMTDQEGNVYRTVQIGTQVWMAENLKTTKIMDSAQWIKDTTGGYSYYDFNSAYDCPYGKLYNGYAVHNQNQLCPTGWHVPSDAEWSNLQGFLGGKPENGSLTGPGSWIGGVNAMRTAGSQYWDTVFMPGGTNSSGLSALPGGSIFKYGWWATMGQFGNYWSSTKNVGLNYPRILYGNSAIRVTATSLAGWSVRCVKDVSGALATINNGLVSY